MGEEKQELLKVFDEMKKQGNFDISVCSNIHDIEDNPKYKKLETTTQQKMQLSALTSQLPAVAALDGISALSNMPKLYSVTIPDGVPYTLMTMKNGNMTTVLRDEHGYFRGYANMAEYTSPANLALSSAVLSSFAVMSVATGQYFLTQINSELDKIKMGMDQILAFLYGHNRAELISEISFVKYAYENFNAISTSDAQRIATIAGVQQAKKVAIKDCEFYIYDLESTLEKGNDISAIVDKALRICDSLKLSMQLCTMGSILETYLSQNFDPNYILYIENDLYRYIDKCETVMLTSLTTLYERVRTMKDIPIKKIPKDKLMSAINDILEPLKDSAESSLKKTLREGLHLPEKQKTFYLNDDGDVYVKAV